MARHALYEGTYRKYHEELNLQNTADIYLRIAVDAASQIMEEGGFSLYNTGNPESDYSTLFNSLDLTTNPEIIQAHYYEKLLLATDSGLICSEIIFLVLPRTWCRLT